MKTKSKQTSVLRKRLLGRLALSILVFTVGLAVVALFLNETIVPRIANEIADATSEWIYLTEEEYTEFARNMDGTWQTEYTADGMYAARNLTAYYTLRDFKIPLALFLYLGGCIFIVYRGLVKAFTYFDQLSGAVAGLIGDKEAIIELPDELFITRAELIEIKERSLANERTAQAAEQRKNELVAYLAHDIKTPLTSVLGYLSLLQESPDLPVESRAKYAGIALDKAERLEGLIDEFFEITRYNLQSIPIEREQVDIQLFCNQVAEEFFPEAEAENITLKVEAPEEETFFVDPDKLARALSNVVKNAVAYAEENSTITLKAEKANEATTITISNQGKEISEVHLESIFEKFYREDSSRTSKKGGAGLGLAITREIIQAHGGTIAAESAQGKTVFTITLPYA